jgi:hypothetical protein
MERNIFKQLEIASTKAEFSANIQVWQKRGMKHYNISDFWEYFRESLV